jgi:phosphate-selective porin OprO/OprP
MGTTIHGQPLRRLAPLALAGASLLVLAGQARAEDLKVSFKPAPQISSADGAYSFKVRGRVETDFVVFDEASGTRDFSNGTDLRAARLGVEGTIATDWGYRFEMDFAGGTAFKDAYLQYNGFQALSITAGQHKTPNSLERLTGGSNLTFLERAMAVEAFTNATNAGGDRKVGVSVTHEGKNWTLTGGVFGENVSITADDGVDEGYGYHARATFAPINSDGKLVHLGVSAYLREPGSRGLARFGDRPEVRMDGGRVVDTGNIDADSYTFVGGEFIGALGSAYVQAEYLRTDVSRIGPASPDVGFDGYYVTAGYFLTGESIPYSKGGIGRLAPKHDLSSGGGTGAWQIAARYSTIDLNDKDILGGKADTYTLGVNWWANPYVRVLLDWSHFDSERQGGDADGNVYGVRLSVNW